jgi:hypothetical protein
MSLDGHLNTYQLAGLRWGTIAVKSNRGRDNVARVSGMGFMAGGPNDFAPRPGRCPWTGNAGDARRSTGLPRPTNDPANALPPPPGYEG